MERLLVLGPPGSGKSTLALEIGRLHGLPVFHLDRFFWRSGWREAEGFGSAVDQLIAADRWVIDGNYGSTLAARLARADGAIFLDYPRRVFFTRMLKRTLRHFGRTRDDMADGCTERLDLVFWRYTWRYRTDTLPRHLAAIRAAGVPLLRFGSQREADAWLAAAAPLAGPTG